MSGTFHHKDQKHAHAGHDLWGARPGGGFLAYSAENKRLTRRLERAEEKRIILHELDVYFNSD